jgi:hypothetical protein
MPRITLSLAEWQNVSRELGASHTESAPPGLQERVLALIGQALQDWPDQPFALELDAGSAAAVRAAHASLTKRDPEAGQRAASVAEAVRIIHDHQRRP